MLESVPVGLSVSALGRATTLLCRVSARRAGAQISLKGRRVTCRERFFTRLVNGPFLGSTNLRFGLQPVIELGTRFIATRCIPLISAPTDAFFQRKRLD